MVCRHRSGIRKQPAKPCGKRVPATAGGRRLFKLQIGFLKISHEPELTCETYRSVSALR